MHKRCNHPLIQFDGLLGIQALTSFSIPAICCSSLLNNRHILLQCVFISAENRADNSTGTDKPTASDLNVAVVFRSLYPLSCVAWFHSSPHRRVMVIFHFLVVFPSPPRMRTRLCWQAVCMQVPLCPPSIVQPCYPALIPTSFYHFLRSLPHSLSHQPPSLLLFPEAGMLVAYTCSFDYSPLSSCLHSPFLTNTPSVCPCSLLHLHCSCRRQVH